MKFSFPTRKNKIDKSVKKPAYVNMRPRIDNSNILEQAKKRKQTNALSNRMQILQGKNSSFPIKRILLGSCMLFLFVGALYLLKNTTIFDVKQIEVITDKQGDYTAVKGVVDGYMSQNILFVSAREIEQKIKDQFSSIHTVYVDKSLSGKLKVEVIEDVPIYYEANNTGIYLINQRGEVMEIVPPNEVLKFDETEQLLRDGQLPADSDQVRIRYLSRLDESEASEIIWKDVPKEEKEATLSQMKGDLSVKINDFSNKLSEQLKEDRFKDLIGSYIPNNQVYAVGDEIPLDSLNFLSLALDFFKSKNLTSTKAVWESTYSLEVFLQDNPSVLLSVKRDHEEQFTDLNTLIYHGQFNGARVVDVRSSNYSVVR